MMHQLTVVMHPLLFWDDVCSIHLLSISEVDGGACAAIAYKNKMVCIKVPRNIERLCVDIVQTIDTLENERR